MPKFQVEFEITGLKLKISGEREDVSLLQRAVQEQAMKLLPTIPTIAPTNLGANTLEVPATEAIRQLSKKGSKPKRKASGESVQLPSWTHNPEKWGYPRQQWTAAQKSIWLLHIFKQENVADSLSAPAIADLSNLHFRQAGALQKNALPKALGLSQSKTPAQVGSHAETSPIQWYLTTEGISIAAKLVDEAKGIAPSE